MPFMAIVALAVITYSFRLAGPLLRDRVRTPDSAASPGGTTSPCPPKRARWKGNGIGHADDLVKAATATLLVSLAATEALTQGHGFAGWARPAGVAVAGLLALKKAPFPVIVVAAAAATALLRLAGVS